MFRPPTKYSEYLQDVRKSIDYILKHVNATTVNKIVAGTNISISPADGTGIVTINSTGSTSTPTLAQVTTAGNTTTNSITVGGLTVATSLIYTDTVNGRVGIGTTSPLFKLDISNRVKLGQYPASINYGAIYLGNIVPSTTNYSLASDSVDTYLNGTSNIEFSINDVIKARIASTGNFLIGTTTDAGYKLDVNGTARIQSGLIVQGITVGLGGGSVASNTSVGYQTLNANTTGIQNTATGFWALYSNTTGNNNTANGVGALQSNTTGTSNSALGMWSLLYNTTGSNNTANGGGALQSNTTGNYNTAIGVGSLLSNNADNNTAVGYSSLNQNTTGAANTALGRYSAQKNTTGNYNTSIGYNANWYNSTGNNNTALGFYALYDSTASNNTAIGYQAGFAGVANSTGSNNIFIGYQATGVSATDSNRTWIGNSSTTSTWLAGNVLIGTTTDAGYKLDVNGTTRVQQTLDIGSVGTSGAINFRRSSDGNITSQVLQTNDVLVINNYQGAGIFHKVDNVTYFHIRGFAYQYAARVMGNLSAVSGLSTALLVDNSISATANNDVLVGLDINPTFTNGAFTGVGNFSLRASGYSHFKSGINIYPVDPVWGSGLPVQGGLITWGADTLEYYAGRGSGAGFSHKFFTNNNTERLRITDGNVMVLNTNMLVGTTTDAGYKLDVNGDVRITGNITASKNQNGSTQIIVSNNTSGASAYSTLKLTSSSGSSEVGRLSASYTAYKILSASDTFIYSGTTGSISLLADSASGTIKLASGASTTAQATLFSTGNFAIGTTTDAGYKLDVNGSARVQGVLTGAFVTLGAANYNQPILSTTGYFTGTGAITTSNYNGRSFNTVLGGQASGIVCVYNGIAQGVTQPNEYFIAGGNINLTDGAITLSGFSFSPTIVSEIGATIKAFNSTLSSASNHYDLYLSGGAKNYIAGNVGIGTSSPSYPLHISSSAAANIYGTVQSTSANGTAAWVAFNDQSDNVVYRVFGSGASGTQLGQSLTRSASLMANLGGTGKFLLGTYSSTDFVMGTGNQERMRIVDSTGNVLVGTTTDSGDKLNVSGNVKASGDIIALTDLRSMYQAGDEGGEIFLNAPATNTTIPGGVTIDVYQNRLRFFCQGGAANGYYLDMPSGGAGVGTNLSPTGFTGTFTVPTNPVGQRNLNITNGIVISVT